MRVLTSCDCGLTWLGHVVGPAHGPQMQVTDTNNKITTREIIPEPPYDTSLTPEKSAYVLANSASRYWQSHDELWTVMPNSTIDPILQTSEFQFWTRLGL